MRRLAMTVWLLALVGAFAGAVLDHPPATEAQVASRVGVQGEISCAGSAGTPTEIAPVRPGRVGYIVQNTSATAVRIGRGTGTTTLTTSNSKTLPASQVLSDGTPGVYTGELRCQSTTTSAVTIEVDEVLR